MKIITFIVLVQNLNIMKDEICINENQLSDEKKLLTWDFLAFI